jgi:hypothetical protein
MNFEDKFKYSDLFSSEINNSNYIIFATLLKKEIYNLTLIYQKYDFLNYDFYCSYDTLINTNKFIIKEKHEYLKKLRKIKSNEFFKHRNNLINIIYKTIQYFKFKYELFLKNYIINNNSKKRKLCSIYTLSKFQEYNCIKNFSQIY